MSDFRDATDSLRIPRVPMLADDLVAIGAALGEDIARRVYYALAREPIDAHGERVDWFDIRSRIVVERRNR